MLKNNLLVIIFAVFILSFTYSPKANVSNDREKLIVLTVPKAGTHLLQKLLARMLNQEIPILPEIANHAFKPYHATDNLNLIFNHPYPCLDHLKGEVNAKKVILIRDPRDGLISFMHWIPRIQNWGPWTPKSIVDFFSSLNDDDRLMLSIYFPDEYLGLQYFYKNTLDWMRDPEAFVCRFEDLVGAKGGGSDEKQKEVIMALSQYLGVSISEEDVEDIVKGLFGGSQTFKDGKIGSWKKYFKKDHIKAFKSQFGDITVQLGYETDNNW